MKKIKSLTCLLAITIISACQGHSSATFSSSINIDTSSSFSDSSVPSETSSSILSSSSESSSSQSNSKESSMESSSSSIVSSSSSVISSSDAHSSISSSSSSSSSGSGSETPVSYYNNYYETLVSWTDSEDLKNQLYTIIRNGYEPLPYTTPNYETNIQADHSYYDFEYLDVVYSADAVYKTETNKGWQREHAFCASLMCGSLTADAVKQKGRATDFHNLFASNASANSSRGNKNYGVANKSHERYTDRTTNDGQDGYSFDPVNFEPGNYDKGRLSRAIFYMATMYKNDENDEKNGITMKGLTIQEDPVNYVSGENGAFAIGNLSTLIDWNNTYAVDYLEMQHNVSVYQDAYTYVNSEGETVSLIQGNRNPYVDFPGLVDYVYGDKKDQPGQLKDLIPSESLLECDKHEFSHYALKEAKRSYEPGSQIENNDYKVVKVYKDYLYDLVNEGYSNSLSNHTFSDADGEAINATIVAGTDTFTYRIILNASGATSTGEIILNNSGVNKGTPGIDQEITLGDIGFYFNFESSANITSSNTMTLTNISTGGITIGSGTKPLTKLVLKTKESYTIDAAYIKAFRGNKDSYYQLTIKVGDSVLLKSTTVNNADVKQFGTNVSTPLTGQLSYIFEGNSSLKINSIAFNEIIA